MIKLYAVEYTNVFGGVEILSKSKGGKYWQIKGHAERLANRINKYDDPKMKAKVITMYLFTADELANLGVKVDE